MSVNKSYCYCFVPGCLNTSLATPEKLFFIVPKGERRKQWCKVVRRDPLASMISHRHCCQDHFNVEQDVQDWLRYKILKDAGENTFCLRLKPNVVPHIFDCQPDRRISHSKPERSAVLKRQAADILKEAVANAQSSGPSTEAQSDIQDEGNRLKLPQNEPTSALPIADTSIGTNTEGLEATLDLVESVKETEESGIALDTSEVFVKEVGVQVNFKPSYQSKLSQTDCHQSMISVMTSPLKNTIKKRNRNDSSELPPSEDSNKENIDIDSSFSVAEDLESSLSIADTSLFEASFSSVSDMSDSDNDDLDKSILQSDALRVNVSIMESNSKLYLGIHKKILPALLYRLESITGQKKIHILIVLRKLRLDEPIDMLADIFGLSKSTVSRVLSETTPHLSGILDACVFWPEKKIIQANVPIAFRANYSHVQSIIDCFEVEIEKPSNPTKQALTWSDYKKCNTLKYLVSIAPDGLINYVSGGFGGRTTDTRIVKECGFLDKLHPNTCVMADRGFKLIESTLVEKGCKLVRPPSVPSGHVMSKEDARATKIIASLRINVERVIGRIREYKFLAPHARFHHELLHLADHYVRIACALCNMQGPIYH